MVSSTKKNILMEFQYLLGHGKMLLIHLKVQYNPILGKNIYVKENLKSWEVEKLTSYSFRLYRFIFRLNSIISTLYSFRFYSLRFYGFRLDSFSPYSLRFRPYSFRFRLYNFRFRLSSFRLYIFRFRLYSFRLRLYSFRLRLYRIRLYRIKLSHVSDSSALDF